jgi:hypothetical protein
MAAKESRHKVTGRPSVDRSYRESERISASKNGLGQNPEYNCEGDRWSENDRRCGGTRAVCHGLRQW